MEAIQIIAYLSLLALANCQERMAQAMPMVNVPDQNKDRGVEIIVNYLTGQKDNYTSLLKKVQDLEAQVADLVSNARSYTGSTNDGNTNCGCPRGPVGPVGPSGLPGPVGPSVQSDHPDPLGTRDLEARGERWVAPEQLERPVKMDEAEQLGALEVRAPRAKREALERTSQMQSSINELRSIFGL
ncbi:hypothetical protein CAPTEDRAFT_191461 [Capitella teleta]|uniref:Uncharacterized protein n=1 Tax=Capitella teleta TaxID=283909 RepID=R7T973_CAPTE|nr:hypothetical protein CAPTEDRAFT_191461 [Capitella teleta]|eukprot:ELT90249.1 hypothetical protein CAPTEDRAFT_191461 [Capitella teleta]